jgi:hypothetical protein
VDQATTFWTSKTGLQSGLCGKRSRRLWMSEGIMLFAAGPSGPPFDPEGQAPTLWARTSWSTGSEGPGEVRAAALGPDKQAEAPGP